MITLRVTELTVAYGPVVAVSDVSFSVESGEALVLLGPNGAGKTSAVEAIAGLLPKRRGKVEFLGRDISRLSASAIVRSGLALVPQWRELFRTFTVEETLLAATKAAVRRAPTPLASVYELFPVLHERRRQTAGSLSGGEQQMLAIARALVTNPKLLLLDEPSAGLASGITRMLIAAGAFAAAASSFCRCLSRRRCSVSNAAVARRSDYSHQANELPRCRRRAASLTSFHSLRVGHAGGQLLCNVKT